MSTALCDFPAEIQWPVRCVCCDACSNGRGSSLIIVTFVIQFLDSYLDSPQGSVTIYLLRISSFLESLLSSSPSSLSGKKGENTIFMGKGKPYYYIPEHPILFATCGLPENKSLLKT
ncbi:hypothetical protein CEXT_186941 [Caerostris extrusa]|uniref:Uncharacterized protein n=1 Tax=Caerostris extrusa TaxID=172846 RepID=A0AAV4VUT6_CAEEX|nr:hypothetical protein CEXT_186941 [Caerostris extrusa]